MNGRATLASRLGTTRHRSLLLRRLAHLGLSTGEALAEAALRRGLDYYAPGGASTDANTGVVDDAVSTEELVVALVHPCLPWEPHRFRLAAALMGAPEVDAKRLALLAVSERCVPMVAEIARAGQAAEPTEPFWPELLALLPAHAPVPRGVMPHPSRYMIIPGRAGPSRWVRPQMLSAR